MSAAFPTTHPTLATPRLLLRPLTEADIPAWFARATDAESARLAGDPIPATIAEGQAWLARHRQRFAEQAALRWSITQPPRSESLGTIGLTFAPPFGPAPGAHTAALGFVIARAHWNHGLASEAARAVTAYAFETLGLAALEAEALRRNTPSRRVLAKLGFRHLRALPPDSNDPDPADLYFLPNPIPPRVKPPAP